MPEIKRHPAGAFCWVELATTDQNAAKSFYGSLFGWSAADRPMGPGASYTMFQLHGGEVAACYSLTADILQHGIPPHWMLYIAVESADKAAAHAVAAGGKILHPPFDVVTYGRMAVIQDPTAAVVSVWEPKSHTGSTVSGEAGTLCWADLSTSNPERAARFYSEVFGWTMDPGHDGSGYIHIRNGQDFIGGIPPAAHRQAGLPPHWLPYFAVAGCDATAAEAKALGGKIHVPSMSLEKTGRLAVLSDPQGATFAIFQEQRAA